MKLALDDVSRLVYRLRIMDQCLCIYSCIDASARLCIICV